MQYYAFQYTIGKIAKIAGIEKRIRLHLFRHSRATELANYLTESQMEENLGWAPGSNMPRTYVHLSGKQIDDAILTIYGKKRKEDLMPELVSHTCTRCKKDNGPTSQFCAQCGLPLDQKVVFNLQEKKDKLPDLLNLIMSSEEGRKLFFEIQKELSKNKRPQLRDFESPLELGTILILVVALGFTAIVHKVFVNTE
jgi:integrase/recombinase XerD